MASIVATDEIDKQILKILIQNARTPINKIATECEISSPAVLKRIARLKKEGVIIGTEIILKDGTLGFPYKASIGITAENSLTNQIAKAIREQPNIIVCARSIGKFNFFSLVMARSLQELNSATQKIKNIPGVKSISINVWIDEPYRGTENL